MPPSRLLAGITLIWLNFTLNSQPADLLIADFEQEGYGDWRTEGEAFGPGPAQGTLPGQMQVSGFLGKGLVSSFYQGDRPTGTLTSPPFRIQRRYLTFLIGGGGYPGETCLNLLIDGETVRTATGPNVDPGGSEELALDYWDLKDLRGQTAVIRVVDARSGGWGHVNVDQILQTDRQPALPPRPGLQTRELKLTKRYLHLPIRNGARKVRVDLVVDGINVREFEAELALSAEDTSFWAFLDVRDFEGQSAVLRADPASEDSVGLIRLSDKLPDSEDLYREPLRPQFHFSQRLGWNNDPNGMVYHDGEWHLYFQHNPYGWKWGNMHWGHAVSSDLVHWEQLPIAIYNPRRGDWAFSGGAVVDKSNTAGWQSGDDQVIVAFWTSTGRGECVAYSNDRGRTFTEFEGNPVVKHQGRDPKVIWYQPGNHWVMAVYDEWEDQRWIAFYTSSDLKHWEFQSRLPGFYECPELFELPVDNDPTNTRWVVFAADAQYVLGQFDGKIFTPEQENKFRVHYGQYYASQLFSDTPDGRRIQIGWARIEMPGMPFNQTFTFPHNLTLRSTERGVRMFAEPVTEIAKLYRKRHVVNAQSLTPASAVSLPVGGELFDIQATFVLGAAEVVGLDIQGERVVYDVASQELRDVPLNPVDGKITLRVLVDRPMLEIIGNSGQIYITAPREGRGESAVIKAFTEGGTAQLLSLEVQELNSIWRSKSPTF